MRAYLAATASIVLTVGVSRAQTPSRTPSQWPSQTEARLNAIYERGDFRPAQVQTAWLLDSSGYTVRERDPQTQRNIQAFYELPSGERGQLPPGTKTTSDRERMTAPGGKHVLEFQGRNLFVRNIENNQRTQLTSHPETQDVRYSDASWSPDGQRVVFVESDSSEVRQRAVLVPDDPSYPGVQHHRFARVGEKLSKLRVGVIDADGQNLQWLPIQWPAEGGYLGQVEWAQSSNELLVEKLSRFRDERQFLLVELNGEVRQIYHEKNAAWAVSSQGKNSGLTWIRGGQAFIVISEKDGWRHAFTYSRSGEELALLTPGEFDIIDRAAVDEDGGWYYFYASPTNATQKYLYRVPLDGSGTMERVTPPEHPGTHDYEFSPDAHWAFHTHSTADSPPIVQLVELPSHRVVRLLEENNEVRSRFKSVSGQPTEFLQLDIGGGTTLDAWMLKPKDFDESKKYPVFVYVYGEPHAQTVLDSWGAAQMDFHRVVTDLGYVVISIDNRGTPAPKGAAWRRSIFGSLGPLSTDEQAAALQELGRIRPYIDLSRVAIWGWSGGGSNTLNAMFRKPDLYHVGIAVVPKPQPHLYNAWFQEIYMHSREANPEGYERSAPINYAAGLKGKLLMITGSGETNTHIQIIEGLVDRLIELGKPFDYMVYPNRDHGLREGRGTQVHVRMLIIRYLLDNLPPGGIIAS
ncbi:MAG: DPP IV N-terminal domain-containing protein [Planctomycetales bacterium]|nr:DPP IV N-terminal domain-containing protein [Planctomycetales bacterium]